MACPVPSHKLRAYSSDSKIHCLLHIREHMIGATRTPLSSFTPSAR